MRQITIRGIPDDLALALEKEKARRGTSLNHAVLELLRQSLGLNSPRYENGLSQFAATWTAEEFADFSKHTEMFEQVDAEDWS